MDVIFRKSNTARLSSSDIKSYLRIESSFFFVRLRTSVLKCKSILWKMVFQSIIGQVWWRQFMDFIVKISMILGKTYPTLFTQWKEGLIENERWSSIYLLNQAGAGLWCESTNNLLWNVCKYQSIWSSRAHRRHAREVNPSVYTSGEEVLNHHTHSIVHDFSDPTLPNKKDVVIYMSKNYESNPTLIINWKIRGVLDKECHLPFRG